MITEQDKINLVSDFNSHTITAAEHNTIHKKLPFISDAYGEFIQFTGVAEYKWVEKRCRIFPVDKYHYKDNWYYYKYSVEKPEETIGILLVENIPYRSFEFRKEKKSFVARMDRMVFEGWVEPFLLFVNRKFVSWNDIDVVFDCDDTYLILHGEKYNRYDLSLSEFHIMTLPFRVEYASPQESDDMFLVNYNALCKYLQDSAYVKDDRLYIDVPTIDGECEYNGSIYNVGAWLYFNLRMYYQGLLSEERIAKLRRITIYRYEYDENDNITSSMSTKFNALDKDSYVQSVYDAMCYMGYDEYVSKALFRFNEDGCLDDSGSGIIALLDDSIWFHKLSSSDTIIVDQRSEIDDILFDENYIAFKNGLVYPEREIQTGINNTIRVDNPDNEVYDIYAFSYKDNSFVFRNDLFFNKQFINDNALEFIKGNTDNLDRQKYIEMCREYLDYEYTDDRLYEDNYENGFSALMDYNPMVFNKLFHSRVSSTVVSGKNANESLLFPLGKEDRVGLKIPRMKFRDHETYVIVFLNGEVIESYSEMIVFPNYFFIPIEGNFNNTDKIELLYFNYCDNNEIHFSMTEYVMSGMEISDEDPKFKRFDVFEKFIKPKELKIFTQYPEEILKYPTLIKNTDRIAFNISYRDSNNDLCLMSDAIIQDREYVAVSRRKFIYQRLYAEQRAYRFVLDKRFRYCDNQKQYMLFINGRRQLDDRFIVTVPKYDRPFWGIYLYVAKFVGPEDRIELFYVPEDVIDDNINGIELQENGYIEYNKKDLIVPYDNRLYLFFINGKKIPSTDLTMIDTHTLRVNSDTYSTNGLVINEVYLDTMPEYTEYLQGDTNSKYDSIIQFIKDSDSLGYDELDNLFNIYEKMTNIEPNKLTTNVAKIAILNEAIRDFWVTSGYEYNEEPCIYDYDLDDFMVIDRHGNLIIPALDANPEINIIKNAIRILYFYCDGIGDTEYMEIGTVLNNPTFYWDYSERLNTPTVLREQYFNDTEIDPDARSYTYEGDITRDREFTITGNNYYEEIYKTINIKFVNGIYYGLIDEDSLQYFKDDPISIEELLAWYTYNGKFTPENPEDSYNDAIGINVLGYDNQDLLFEGVDFVAGQKINTDNNNKKFVAIAYNSNNATYSIDGINWVQTTMPVSAYWSSVAYGDGKFVAISGYGNNSNIAAYSTNGINWTETTMPASTYWISVTYGDGKFVAVCSGITAAYSIDGINWVQTTMPVSAYWSSVAYGDGKFVAVCSGITAAYSIDGINWVQTTMPASAIWASATYGDGKFVAVSGYNNTSIIAAYSEDGINWIRTTLPVIARWYSVTYGNGKFVVISGHTSASSIAAYSEDGINWIRTTMPTSTTWNSVMYGDDKFVAVSGNNNNSIIAAYSIDGINWVETTMPASTTWNSVMYGDDIISDNDVAMIYDIDLEEFIKAADKYNPSDDDSDNGDSSGGTNTPPALTYNPDTGLPNYMVESDLQPLMSELTKVLQDTTALKLENYVIGNNNYFVYAAPRRLLYDKDMKLMTTFVLPDIHSDEVVSANRDDKTTPVLTDGNFDNQNCLVKLDNLEMMYLGEFQYTNDSGYKEPYVLFRTNGFFTRLYDDYGFTIEIIDRKHQMDDLIGS